MPLDEYFKTGTIIDAKVTDQLLRNLFFKNSPLHDGAVIVRGSRVAAAGCVMPLSKTRTSRGIGTRHRAGIGTQRGLRRRGRDRLGGDGAPSQVAPSALFLKRHLAPQDARKALDERADFGAGDQSRQSGEELVYEPFQNEAGTKWGRSKLITMAISLLAAICLWAYVVTVV